MYKPDLNKCYNDLAEDYLKTFISTMELEGEAFWVANDVGTVACVGDYFVDYKDIRLCVDNNIPFKDFDEWYCYCIEVGMISDELYTPSLEEWVSGKFQKMSDTEMSKFKEII